MKVVIRPPKPGDAAGLAIAARDLAEQYSELEPDRFHVPESGEQIASYQEALRKPIPEHRVWLVAEVNGGGVGEAQATIHEPMADAGVQPLRDMGRCRV